MARASISPAVVLCRYLALQVGTFSNFVFVVSSKIKEGFKSRKNKMLKVVVF